MSGILRRWLCLLCCMLLLPACVLAETEPVDVLSGSLPYLVNREYPVDKDFQPADLVLLTDVLDASIIKVKYKKTQAVRAAAEALETMLEAA